MPLMMFYQALKNNAIAMQDCQTLSDPEYDSYHALAQFDAHSICHILYLAELQSISTLEKSRTCLGALVLSTDPHQCSSCLQAPALPEVDVEVFVPCNSTCHRACSAGQPCQKKLRWAARQEQATGWVYADALVEVFTAAHVKLSAPYMVTKTWHASAAGGTPSFGTVMHPW